MRSLDLASLIRIAELQAMLVDAEFDLDQFMPLVVSAAETLAGGEIAVVELVEGHEMVYRCTSASLSQHVGMRLPREGSFSGLCVQTREILKCDDSETDSRVNKEACRRVGARSLVCTPLVRGDDAVGVLKVMSSRVSAFDDTTLHQLRVIAGLLGSALGRQLEIAELKRLQHESQVSEARAIRSEARTRAILNGAAQAIICIDDGGRITEWNAAAEVLFGCSAHEMLARDASQLPLLHEVLAELRTAASAPNVVPSAELTQQRRDVVLSDRQGRHIDAELSWSVVGQAGTHEVICLLHNIADRKAEQARLAGLANEDVLTGLPNRRLFSDALQRALARGKRHHHSFALLYLDLDGFKDINDRYGHAVGDRALCVFATRVKECLRREDVFARLVS